MFNVVNIHLIPKYICTNNGMDLWELEPGCINSVGVVVARIEVHSSVALSLNETNPSSIMYLVQVMLDHLLAVAVEPFGVVGHDMIFVEFSPIYCYPDCLSNIQP